MTLEQRTLYRKRIEGKERLFSFTVNFQLRERGPFSLDHSMLVLLAVHLVKERKSSIWERNDMVLPSFYLYLICIICLSSLDHANCAPVRMMHTLEPAVSLIHQALFYKLYSWLHYTTVYRYVCFHYLMVYHLFLMNYIYVLESLLVEGCLTHSLNHSAYPLDQGQY